MENEKVLSEVTYKTTARGMSLFSDQFIEIIGERTIELEDGRVIEQFLYNIEGYTPENGKPFASLKANIVLS